MLEGVFDIGKEARFVEELCCLQVRQATVERRFGQLGNSVEKRAGDVLANHGCGLEQVLLRKWEPVDPSCQHCQDGRWYLNSPKGCYQAIGPPLPNQSVGLDQGLDDLLQEERIALRPRNQALLERPKAGILPQEVAEQFHSILG